MTSTRAITTADIRALCASEETVVSEAAALDLSPDLAAARKNRIDHLENLLDAGELNHASVQMTCEAIKYNLIRRHGLSVQDALGMMGV